MSIGIIELVVGVGLLVAIVSLMGAMLRREELVAWAGDLGVEVTRRNEGFLRSYLLRTRTLRSAGGVAGFLSPFLFTAFAGKPPPEPFDFSLFNALVGYLLGAVVAEMTFRRPRADVPTASLVPRDLDAYIPSWIRRSVRALAAFALVLIPLFLTLPHRESDLARVRMLPALLLIPMIGLVILGVETLARLIVRRPQPAVEPDLIRADDAVRSASVHALVGAGIALELLIVSVEIAGIGFVSDIQLLRWTLPWLALVCFVGSLGAWVRVTRPRGWRVRRVPLGAGA